MDEQIFRSKIDRFINYPVQISEQICTKEKILVGKLTPEQVEIIESGGKVHQEIGHAIIDISKIEDCEFL